MAWRDELQGASFRGVPFFVEQETGPAGRRTQTHEFVQRDMTYVEDLGRATGEIKLTAFVIGEDCLRQRDELLKVLDEPGPGELIHPWKGRLTATATKCECSHHRREGGMVRFDLTFVEQEDTGAPVGVVNTGRLLAGTKMGMLAGALARFRAVVNVINTARANMMALRGQLMTPYLMAKEHFRLGLRAINNVDEFARLLVSDASGFLALFAKSSTRGPELIGIDDVLAEFLPVVQASSEDQATLSSAASGGSTVSAASASSTASSAVQSNRVDYAGAVNVLQRQAEAVSKLNVPATAGDAITQQVADAARELVRDLLLVQIHEVAAVVPVRSKPVTLPAVVPVEQQVSQSVERETVPVKDDVLKVRDELDAIIWAAIAMVSADYAEFVAVEQFRRLIRQHLNRVAAGGVRLVELTPRSTTPALVLAYRQFEDASRSAELVMRNGIRHPGFVPAVPLLIPQE